MAVFYSDILTSLLKLVWPFTLAMSFTHFKEILSDIAKKKMEAGVVHLQLAVCRDYCTVY